MKAATSLMNRGLIAHSTETVATTAVMMAGMAATSENRATNRLCSRAPARAARRAALRRASSIEIRMMRMTTTKPSPDQQNKDDGRGRNDRREAGENQKRRQSEDESRADDDNSNAAGRPGVLQKRRPARVESRRSSQIREPKAAKPFARRRAPLAPPWQTGNDVAQVRRLRHRVRQYADPARRRRRREPSAGDRRQEAVRRSAQRSKLSGLCEEDRFGESR